MAAQKSTKKPETMTVNLNDREGGKGQLKALGGSQSDKWNRLLADQAFHALWLNSDAEKRQRQVEATVAALSGIKPENELEGMLAAQLIAAHNAAMECYRRAMIAEADIRGAA